MTCQKKIGREYPPKGGLGTYCKERTAYVAMFDISVPYGNPTEPCQPRDSQIPLDGGVHHQVHTDV
jgi:hypothetical protein